MSVHYLRRAANLMRGRAAAATPGEWTYETAPDGSPPMVVGDDMVVAETHDKPHLSDAAHIASWRPEVAFAVADSLDATANRIERRPDFALTDTGVTAIAVARAYLRMVS